MKEVVTDGRALFLFITCQYSQEGTLKQKKIEVWEWDKLWWLVISHWEQGWSVIDGKYNSVRLDTLAVIQVNLLSQLV